MKTKIRYYVIITYQYNKKNCTIRGIRPAMIKRPLFYPTDVEDLTEEYGVPYINRKYCGELSAEQLTEFLREHEFTSTCQTLGALTMEYGWLGAVAFDYSEYAYSCNAYISPIIEDVQTFNETVIPMPTEQQKVVEKRVNIIFDRIMEWLSNEAIDNYDEMPDYCKEVIIDLYQL